MRFLFALWIIASTSLGAVETRDLTHGRLFLPATPLDGPIPLHIHLHGDSDVVVKNFRAAGRLGALFTINRPGLSSAYRHYFADPEVWPALIAEVGDALAHWHGSEVEPGPVSISSFSAGFGGVRELLMQPLAYAQIDSLLLADSLYSGFNDPVSERHLDPDLLKPFLRFAKAAAAGEKFFLLTHTEVHTPTYGSTRETAAYLMEAVGALPEFRDEKWTPRLPLMAAASLGEFHVLSFGGDTGEDHLEHLREIRYFLRLMP